MEKINMEIKRCEKCGKAFCTCKFDEKEIDYLEKIAEHIAEMVAKAHNEGFVRGVKFGLNRHTWMKDGLTYVGNGTYSLTQAIESLKADGIDITKV